MHLDADNRYFRHPQVSFSILMVCHNSTVCHPTATSWACDHAPPSQTRQDAVSDSYSHRFRWRHSTQQAGEPKGPKWKFLGRVPTWCCRMLDFCELLQRPCRVEMDAPREDSNDIHHVHSQTYLHSACTSDTTTTIQCHTRHRLRRCDLRWPF